jgi:hypothetical protein
MKYSAVLLIVTGMLLYAQEKDKVGLNLVFGGGFNTMKSWENYPDAADNLDDIPGAGLISMRAEYDFGQHMKFPFTFLTFGADVPITQIGKIGMYDSSGDLVVDTDGNMKYYEYSNTTAFTELGIIKKFFIQDMGLFAGGSWIHQIMSLDKDASDGSFSENYSLSSNGFKGLVGMDYNLGKAWFFEIQVSYTANGSLVNEDGDGVFTEDDEEGVFSGFPIDDVKEDEYLVPEGLSVKIGMGLRI